VFRRLDPAEAGVIGLRAFIDALAWRQLRYTSLEALLEDLYRHRLQRGFVSAAALGIHTYLNRISISICDLSLLYMRKLFVGMACSCDMVVCGKYVDVTSCIISSCVWHVRVSCARPKMSYTGYTVRCRTGSWE